MREAASERESGRDKEERSTSSNQGRRWERPWRTVVLRRDMKARKAGVAIGGWDSDWGLEIGRVAGEAIADLERESAGRLLDSGV